MKRSCYALTWLMGTLAGCLVAVNVVSGQHPPAGAPDDAPDDAAASQRTVDDASTTVQAVTVQAVTAVTAGPLGWLPYDDEYHCEVPSENPDALPSLSIWDGVRVVEATPIGPFDGEQAAEGTESSSSGPVEANVSAVTIVTTSEAPAEQGAVESLEPAPGESSRGEGELPFRVLGYGAISSESFESVDEPVSESEVVFDTRVASSGSPVAVAWMRGFARTLQAAGDWFDEAAGSLEGRTDLAAGD